MPKLNIPPTKSSLMKMKDQDSMAREGFELLEQKREILVMELMKRVEQLKLFEDEIEKRLQSSYEILKKLIIKLGLQSVTDIGKGINFNFRFKEKREKIIGISMPSFDVDTPSLELKYSFLQTYALCDKTILEFFELLKEIARMATIRTTVWRLAREVKKTQRRVNALEKIVIPETEDTIKYIQSVLEEKEREAFFVLKILKARILGEKE